MSRNKWETINGIFIKGTIENMLEEGKSRDDVVDFFHKHDGYFMWHANNRKKWEDAV